MDPARYESELEELRRRIADLPAGARTALEELAAETAARHREILAAHAQALDAAARFDAAAARLHTAATATAGQAARALDGVQDALIDLNLVALDLESENRRRGGSR